MSEEHFKNTYDRISKLRELIALRFAVQKHENDLNHHTVILYIINGFVIIGALMSYERLGWVTFVGALIVTMVSERSISASKKTIQAKIAKCHDRIEEIS